MMPADPRLQAPAPVPVPQLPASTLAALLNNEMSIAAALSLPPEELATIRRMATSLCEAGYQEAAEYVAALVCVLGQDSVSDSDT